MREESGTDPIPSPRRIDYPCAASTALVPSAATYSKIQTLTTSGSHLHLLLWRRM